MIVLGLIIGAGQAAITSSICEGCADSVRVGLVVTGVIGLVVGAVVGWHVSRRIRRGQGLNSPRRWKWPLAVLGLAGAGVLATGRFEWLAIMFGTIAGLALSGALIAGAVASGFPIPDGADRQAPDPDGHRAA